MMTEMIVQTAQKMATTSITRMQTSVTTRPNRMHTSDTTTATRTQNTVTMMMTTSQSHEQGHQVQQLEDVELPHCTQLVTVCCTQVRQVMTTFTIHVMHAT